MGSKPYTFLDNKKCFFSKNEIVLEIGSDRGEGSTDYLALFATKNKIPFYTVDINTDIYSKVKDKPNVRAFNMTGEKFLSEVFPGFNQKIRVAYFDNFDWWWQESLSNEEYHKIYDIYYEPYGLKLNNDNSQKAHLEQVQLANQYALKGSIFIFDDTWRWANGKSEEKAEQLFLIYLIKDGL